MGITRSSKGLSGWRFITASIVMLLVWHLTAVHSGRAGAAMTAQPGNANLDTLLDNLQRHYQATKSFSAKFDETINRVGAPPLHRSGIIYYEKPGKLRWEFEGSEPETIVSDGKTLYDFDPGLNQVIETPLAQAFRSQAAAAFLLGAGNVKRDFNAQLLSQSENDSLIHVALTPRRGGERLEVGINRKTYNIASLAISDAMGNRTEFRFSEIKLNPPLDASLFRFTPPAGADIVNAGAPR